MTDTTTTTSVELVGTWVRFLPSGHVHRITSRVWRRDGFAYVTACERERSQAELGAEFPPRCRRCPPCLAAFPAEMSAEMCPECRAHKCGNCDGRTWDEGYDRVTDCPCAVAGHPRRDRFDQP